MFRRLTLAVVLLSARSPQSSASDALRGEDAFLVLERSGQCGSWRVSVYHSGRAHVASEDTCGRGERTFSRLLDLPAESLATIDAAVRDARFFELPTYVETLTFVTDDDYLTLKAQSGAARHSMSLQGEQLHGTADVIQRFRSVWQAVQRVVPEPVWKGDAQQGDAADERRHGLGARR